jgi:CheY-like chemotaxis protein
VLLVDDEALIRGLAKAVLEGAGFNVIEAEDGAEAVELFRARASDIQLVILDLTMPRMSGRDAFQAICEIDPAARVLFSSGYSAEDLSDLNGAVGMLPKPYRPAQLLSAVEDALKANLQIA